MVYRIAALCLALAVQPVFAQETPLLPPLEGQAPQEPQMALQADPLELESSQGMQANEIERLLAGPKNNAAAIEAITNTEAPGQALTDGAVSVAKTAIMPSVTAAGTTALTGAVAAVAAPAIILGGIAVVGAGVACAQFCDEAQK